MEIIPTSSKNKEFGLEVFTQRKEELKRQIENQREKISISSQNLFSFTSMTSYVFRVFSKSFNLVDGVMLGFKVARSIIRLFRKK